MKKINEGSCKSVKFKVYFSIYDKPFNLDKMKRMIIHNYKKFLFLNNIEKINIQYLENLYLWSKGNNNIVDRKYLLKKIDCEFPINNIYWGNFEINNDFKKDYLPFEFEISEYDILQEFSPMDHKRLVTPNKYINKDMWRAMFRQHMRE